MGVIPSVSEGSVVCGRRLKLVRASYRLCKIQVFRAPHTPPGSLADARDDTYIASLVIFEEKS